MASLKELRNRIASVKATQKITKAMQMVAAAKLRRAQEAAKPLAPIRSEWSGVAIGPPFACRCAGVDDGTGRDDVHC